MRTNVARAISSVRRSRMASPLATPRIAISVGIADWHKSVSRAIAATASVVGMTSRNTHVPAGPRATDNTSAEQESPAKIAIHARRRTEANPSRSVAAVCWVASTGLSRNSRTPNPSQYPANSIVGSPERPIPKLMIGPEMVINCEVSTNGK